MFNLLIRAKAYFNFAYTCADCGKTAIGERASVAIDAPSIPEFTRALTNRIPASKYMPIGWSYNGKFHCKECYK